MKALTQKTIIPLVVGANVEFERSPYSDIGSDYEKLSHLANTTDTAGRVEIAQAIILYGSDEVRTSRAMDNCFENNDGNKVRAALERRALSNPQLALKLRGVFA